MKTLIKTEFVPPPPEWLKEHRVWEWNRDLRERVGEPLRPEALNSVFIVVPGSSGDVALATSVVRWVKERNPDCKVSFASKRANLSLLEMCPGVDEIVESPTVTFDVTPARRIWRERYAGRADVVIHPICLFEDQALMRRYDFLETMWLLSGVPDGMPQGPHRLWMEPPDAAATAARVLTRCVSARYADELSAEARRRPGKTLGDVVRKRTLSNVGWTFPMKLRRHAAFVRTVAAQFGPADATDARRFVILSNEAGAVPPAPPGLFEEIVRFLRAQGRVVLQNVLDPARALPGTVPLVCSYPEFLSLRQAGVPFVGWRSGLCDIAAAAPAPMCVLYPPRVDGCWIGMMVNCETILKSFGFGSMNVAANCIEFDCYSAEDVDFEKLATILD